jgi:hypothetical protein
MKIAEGVKKYVIEKITGDNRRPGMPKDGWIVWYRLHPSFGWTCRRCVDTEEEAEAFAGTLTPEGDLQPADKG